MIAAASLVVVVLVSLIVTRVATVALMSTGLSRDVARFQARSALTGVGYTTGEAESIVGHPIRRRVVMLLMLIGNAGLVTIVASTIFSFAGQAGAQAKLIRLLVVLVGLVVIFLISKSRRADRWMTRVIARLLSRYTDLQIRDYVRLLDLAGDYAVTELRVEPGDWLADRRLSELALTEEGILVLGIHTRDRAYVGVPRGETVLRAGDTVVMYGRTPLLAGLDDRPAGRTGDRAHQEAVREQRSIEETEEEAAS